MTSRKQMFVRGKTLDFLVNRINFLGVKELEAFNKDAKAFLKRRK